MTRKIIIFLAATLFITKAQAQLDLSYVHKGEFGVTVGAAQYFGDLNTRAWVNTPKITAGAFFRKQFGNYVGFRLSAHYAQLGYSDTYSRSVVQRNRNLSFNTNIWELAVQGDFNFYKFIPGDPNYKFTPYITLGVGAFSFDPYAYLNGQKYFLRQMGTEGQIASYKGRKPYSSIAVCFPLGVGFKYNISQKVNISFEIAHRFTTTDYIDDVSTTYAGPSSFPNNADGTKSIAFYLQDRSGEVTTTPYGSTPGVQRGNAKQKDQYLIAEIGVSFNFGSYRCPSAY